jgi:branched-chain amino acid transport system ATP-binding protein
MAILDVRNIYTYYGERPTLRSLSMQVEQHSIVALLGRNGMGKTTLIRSIIGFNPPRTGVISYKEEDITHFKPYQIAKMGIGLVPQGRNIFPSLSVRENLVVAARTKAEGKSWTLESVYAHFPILARRSYLKGNLLSGGEQQMLAIGRAIMTNPDLLLMDEPSEGLAPLIVLDIGSIITQLKNDGFSILLVEQNLSMALNVSDYAFIVCKGEIVYDSAPHDLEENEEIKEKYLCVNRGKQVEGAVKENC